MSVAKIEKALDAEARLAPEDTFYDINKKEYLLPDTNGGWLSLTEQSFKRQLRGQGFRAKADSSEMVSPIDQILNWLQLHASVSYAGALSGYKAGRYAMQGKSILVTSSPVLVEPREGEWASIRNLIDSLLVDVEFDQCSIFFSWLHTAIYSIYEQKPRTGQVLVLAGPKDCGKSLLQTVMTMIMGGRSAHPFQFASGETPFNSELFNAEHLIVEDESPTVDLRARRRFGAFIKQVAANQVQRLHAKNREALSLEPHWRMSVSVNIDYSSLMVLPPLDDSLLDKLIMLRCNSPSTPFNDGTEGERAIYMKRLQSELPAFAFFLLNWPIPKECTGTRYGVRSFIHPAIGASLSALSESEQLMHLVDLAAITSHGKTWIGPSDDLERILLECPATRVKAERLFTFSHACGVFLADLELTHPHRVRKSPRTGNKRRLWEIYPEDDDGQTCSTEVNAE